jgi:hypothetical protein
MNRTRSGAIVTLLGVLALVAVACGGPGRAAPTALPPDLARPEQPEPRYPVEVGPFTRFTPAPPRFTGTASVTAAGRADARTGVAGLPVEQRPTALGIVRGTAMLLDSPGGTGQRSLAAGTTVTVTGRNGDGTYYAVFSADGVPGWVAAPALVLYGADDLETVAQTVGPGPIATMVAEAMEPMVPSVLDAVADEAEQADVR